MYRLKVSLNIYIARRENNQIMAISLKNKTTILPWLIGIAYSSLFFPLQVSNIFLILLVVYCAFTTAPRDLLVPLRLNVFSKLILFFFALHLVGLLYTSNLDNGLFVIEKKIWLLAIPLFVVPAIAGHRESGSIFRWIGILSMVSGGVLLMIATYRHYILDYPQAFDYITGNQFEGFTPIHYVYYSMYFATGSIFLLDDIFDKVVHKKYGILLIFILITYSLGIIFLVASKMAIFVYGFVVIVFLYFKIHKKRFFALCIVMLTVLAGAFFYLNEATRSRFEGLGADLVILEQDVLPEKVEFTGLNLRLLFWKINIQHAWQDGVLLTGVGTGDAQDYIDSIYSLPQYKLYGYLGWDSHNQWVYSLLQLGVLGVLSLAGLYFISFNVAIRNRDLKLLAFLIITLFFSMTESILELNKGIVFFALIFALLTSRYTKRV
jgi:O-antigen ligase